jgi:PIN domain nuclease of toxin-antitoxin system
VSVLLDTQAFLWWISDSPKLSRRAQAAIADEHCFLSIASCWEMAIKVSLGKLEMPRPLQRFLQEQLEINGFAVLPVSLEQAAAVSAFPFHHRDPFDRLLAAQALDEEIPVVSSDPVFKAYGVKRIW